MKTVLIVDDDPLMIRLYERTLMLYGFKVLTAENGQQGYEMALRSQPDLILMDVMMPVMNGLDALKKLKSDPKAQNIKIVILSNLANTEEAKSALKTGALAYYIKSESDPEDIVDAIKKFLADA